MKQLYIASLIWIVTNFLVTGSFAQKPEKSIRLKNGLIKEVEKLRINTPLRQNLQLSVFNKKIYALVQFDHLPDSSQKVVMSKKGIVISGYLSDKTYYAEIADSLQAADLLKFNISGVSQLPAELKVSRELQKRITDKTFRVTADKPVAISYSGTLTLAEVKASLEKLDARIVNTKIQLPNVLFIDATAQVVKKIADLPFVNYVTEQTFKDIPLNNNNRNFHGLAALSIPSGRNLQGKGVTIGVGDDANPSTHIDFGNRLIIRTPSGTSRHGTHTAGTAAGGGIVNPLYKGMAPKATIISKFCSDVLVDAPVYVADNNMVLTNNSYFSGEYYCPGDGEYNLLSAFMDHQLNLFPSLLHVFAAGNDGQFSCTPYATPYGTVKSGFQCGKNVLTVGNINPADNSIYYQSSAGPVNDGRIKPEIVAGGVNVTSTWPNNLYGTYSGTSMSSPTVTGTLALLYERYRQLHGNADPDGSLIKAIACNSATDMGNPGPDYRFGFGALNARKAVEAIEKETFLIDQVSDGGVFTYSLPVPSAAHQLKVMLYWSDPEASPGAPASLVNNLDITVTTPLSVVHYPLVLNSSPSNVANNATELVDTLNNIEQVVLNSPASGTYTITVNGASVTSGPQRFYIVYEIIEPSVTLEYPFGKETLVPGESENIRWSASGGDGNTFSLEYSLDNGSTWTLIDNAVPDASRSYSWIPPASASNEALVRVTRNTIGYSDVSDYPFTILGQPVISSISNPCQGYVSLQWNTVTSATEYQILMLKGDSMEVIGNTTSTNYLVDGLDRTKTYWFSICAVNGTTPGRRSVAMQMQPSAGDCTFSDFDNDFSVDSLLVPNTGRLFTLSQLGTSENIIVRLKNLGNNASAGSFTVNYRVNGTPVVSESISSAMAAHSSINYTFTTPFNFSASGTYIIKVWVDYPGDNYQSNDTLTTTIKQLVNTAITLSPSFTEGFEGATGSSHTSKIMGVDGLDRCDFNNNNSNGRLRTFVNSGFARSGNRCITLDQVFNNGVLSADSLTATFNLSSYTLSDNILLNFFYKNHGINVSLPGNAVWVRGSEISDWIKIFTLPVNTSDIGGYRASPSINITEALASAVPAQTFTSSFQLMFGENGYKPANSPDAPGINVDNGFSFDDVTFTKSLNDLSVITIQQPVLSGACTLSASEIIRVNIKNSGSADLTNVPVVYKVDGITINENIPFIGANSTILYSFTIPADLSAYKEYQLHIWTDFAGDTYHLNDTISVNFRTSPVISSFPYQEGFESSNGYWFTGGTNSSWQWGTPSKSVISSAAGGTKVWATGVISNYNNNEYSFLYSPCFDLSALTNPSFAFSHIIRVEDNCDPGICDTHWAEYSTDDISWVRLGAQGSGLNWYDNASNIWKMSKPNWHESIIGIPVSTPKIRLRFVMTSDAALSYDGVGIDNIRVFDSIVAPLPLTLISFKAVKESSNGVLTWSTSQEINTDQFIIQKSLNGINYSDIGSVKSTNAGTITSQYRFTDYNLANGVNIYRLKMIDKDGSFTWSPARTINYETKGNGINIYPNPVTKGIVYIDATTDCSQIELSDLSGRVLKTLPLKGLKNTLTVKGITRGTYFVTVTTTEGKKTRRILID